MRRKKRGYVRETPKNLLRDYKLFAIACEGGKKEPQYFKLFEYLSDRIKVDIIEDKVLDEELFHKFETKSAPKWVLDRAVSYIDQEGLIDEDELWFVMDIDNWSAEQLHKIVNYCKEQKNWNIVLSNPCFEVWLYLHKNKDFDSSVSHTCKDFKLEVSELDKGGYNPLNYITLIKEASNNAKLIDTDLNSDFPEKNNSKLYKLIDSVFEFISQNQFQHFCDVKYVDLIKSDKTKFKKPKVKVKVK